MPNYPSYNELDKFYKSKLTSVLGEENLEKIYQVHPDVINFVFTNSNRLEAFLSFLEYTGNAEEDLARATRCYFYECCFTIYSVNELPEWLNSMNFEVTFINIMNSPESIEAFKKLSNKTIFNDKFTGKIINLLGIENIKRFEQETGFFSNNQGKNTSNKSETLNVLGRLISYIDRNHNKKCVHTYQQFKDLIAQYIEDMRSILSSKIDYSFIKGDFRKEYPYLFLPENAPASLRNYFYNNPHKIDFAYLGEHTEYLPYLRGVHLESILDKPRVLLRNSHDEKGQWDYFIKYYVTTYNRDSFLELIKKYGGALSLIMIGNHEIIIDSKETIEASIRKTIYNRLSEDETVSIKHFVDHNAAEFMSEYPDIFISYEEIPLNEPQKDMFYESFYNRTLTFEYIQSNPELISLLKEKNLKIILANCYEDSYPGKVSPLQLLKYIDNLSFLKLVIKYGEYLHAINNELEDSFMRSQSSFEEICKEIEKCISTSCRYGKFNYDPNTAPSFLKKQNPDLFLDDDIPSELYEAFYEDNPDFNFEFIVTRPEYIPYLKGKSLVGALSKNASFTNKSELLKFFTLFDTNTALKLITQKPTTLEQMINDGKSDIVKTWYEKTGHKFIPDYIVMTSFPIREIDKFLANSKSWSKLQKFVSFSDTAEHKDALLKMVYSFGIFDGDKKGFEQLTKLLSDIPRHIPESESTILTLIDFIGTKSHSIMYQQLKKALLREGFSLDTEKPIMPQLYRLNQDKSYTLAFNPQKYPASTAMIRNFFRIIDYMYVLTPDKTHRLFSGFALIYDKEFKDFLLDNLDNILADNENSSQLSNIQKQFKEIKVTNSNRTLTWELAVSYCFTNKYDNVEIGNGAVAEIASIAGYSKEDFSILQKIYNYGKQRVFSSIPRIQGEENGYSYEILRLDDPLALSIGTLTDCCQEIGNIAELCVEHSMVDKNGRIFVVRDEEGNIVSQSWVWRNNTILCFDNIEIPDKAFKRARTDKTKNDVIFTDQVFAVYKKAATEFILEDTKKIHELLEQGIITKQQYEENRLKRVTVGIGYNDIAESIKRNATIVEPPIVHPLPFEAPVPLKRCLWTSDSMTQYLMAGVKETVTIAKTTYSLYSDPFIVYNRDTFTTKNLIHLQKLESAMENRYYHMSEIKEHQDPNLEAIAQNYGLNSSFTKILMNPNLAIVYEESDKIRVIDFLYNTKIEDGSIDMTDAVLLQIKLAFEQLCISKELDISLLSQEQISMYNKAMSISEDKLLEEQGIKSIK